MKTGVAGVFRAVSGWTAFIGLALVWGVVVAPLTLLLQRFWPGAREHFVRGTTAVLGAYVRWLPLLCLEVINPENRLEGARILVVNHQSRLDSPILIALEPRVCGPVRGYMLRVPLVGTVIRLLGFFDIDVGERASVAAVNHATEQARREDRPLLFYPEGTRSLDGEIGEFRRGAFRAAFDHELPIQPIVIEGIEAVLPPGTWLPPSPARYPVKVCYLDPLRPPFGSGGRRRVVRDMAERVRRSMAEELADLRARRHGERPQPAPAYAAGGAPGSDGRG